MSSTSGSVTTWLKTRGMVIRESAATRNRYVGALVRHACDKLGKLTSLIGSEDVALMAFHSLLRGWIAIDFPSKRPR